MANKIQQINMDLKQINEEATAFGLQSQIVATVLSPSGGGLMKNRETDSVTIDMSFVGRDDDVSAIVTQLTATSNNQTISVLPIVGMGGIGKTTLARKVFNDRNIEKHFDNNRIWVCVSDDFNSKRIFGLILESLEVEQSEAKSKEAQLKKLKEKLDGKKFLLVLDDVWNEESTLWNEFLRALKGTSQVVGSWILVTTRKLQVANITSISSSRCDLKPLSEDKCWLILKEIAFGAEEVPNGLQHVGLKIAKKCGGLPLAASVLGSMLRNKRIDERQILDEWQTLESRLQSLGGDENIDIAKILKLSFDLLPYPSLKNCFAYCSIFPKDFEMKRNELIQLWAAEGFLHSNPGNNRCMEEVGNMYFTVLLDSNLFQDAEKDEYGNVLNCKMHDLVHDMVQSISKFKPMSLKELAGSDSPGDTVPIQCFVMERSGGEEIPLPLNESLRYVTTLFLLENVTISDGLISFLTCLRVLNLASLKVRELPKSIRKLFRLRYLDLSDTSIKTLPDSFCKLYNLLSLRVQYCTLLTKFPNNFKNLVNLRHFDFFSKDKSSGLMPLEIGQLHSLQTLPFFNIGEEVGRQIRQLGSLTNLSGSFEIRNLELVRNMEEAKSANLIGKPNINELRLSWNELDNSRGNDSEYNQVLEGLYPHQNLKGLIIENFFGHQLSTWIAKLEKLVKLELQNCKNCKELPTLGHMPSLKSLFLEGLDSVTSIGPSFYGGLAVHGGTSSQRPLKLFPVLKFLILKNMPNLSEWIEAPVHDETIEVFSVLETISIQQCPQIVTCPGHFPRLKNLYIWGINNGSSVLTNICNGVSTLADLSLEDVRGLIELPNMLFQNNANLANLKLCDCHDLTQFLNISSDGLQIPEGPNYQIVPADLSQPHTYINNNASPHLVGLRSLERLEVRWCILLKSISIPRGPQYLTALQSLTIRCCNGLTHLSIPQISESESDSTCSPSSATCLPSFPLQELNVRDCPNLISFPIDLTRIPSLSSLSIPRCDKLIHLPKGELCSLASLRELKIGPFSETTKLDSFLDLFDACQPPCHYFPSLSELNLYGWPHWESLPDQLQHLSALRTLSLENFGVRSLPEWFGKLSSLETLILYNCAKLEYLPSHQSMKRLTQLTNLRINGQQMQIRDGQISQF